MNSRLLLMILFLASGFVVPLEARENRQIRWKPVKGARGYVIQYRRVPEGETEERRVKRPRADLRLPAGNYELRVAALNKFLKPSVWTEWTPVRLDRISAVVDLARAQKGEQEVDNDPPQEKPVAEPASDAGPDADADAANQQSTEQFAAEQNNPDRAPVVGFHPSRLIPGLPQIARGQPYRGAAYALLFAGLAAAGASEWRAAEGIAADLRNDPTVLALLILPNSLELGLYLREERLRSEREFLLHERNQAALGAAALVLYAVHLVDAFLFDPGRTLEPAGLPQEGPAVRFDLLPIPGPGVRPAALHARVEYRLRF